MSWSFSPVLVAAFSAANCSDTESSVPLNTTPTPDQFCWPDKPTEHSRLSRFGTTCELLTGNRGAELLTWYLAGFPVKTSASPETVPGWMVSAADFGEKWPASLAKYDPASHSLKTAQLSLLADLIGCSPTLPRSGLMRDGECWELPMLEAPTAATASGFWPTPTICGNYNRKGASKTSGDGLATSVTRRTYPTATATAYKGWSPNHNRAATDDRLDYTIERESFVHGQQTPLMRLNPDWVEWLMGWPIGQTELKPLETDRFREFVRQHGECLEAAE